MVLSPQDIERLKNPLSEEDLREADRIEAVIDAELRRQCNTEEKSWNDGVIYNIELDRPLKDAVVDEIKRRYFTAGWKMIWYSPHVHGQCFEISEERGI